MLHAKGFTLIEILIFTAIISVFFVVAAAVSAFSLRIMQTNENKVYATHYAEEATEWLLNEKETTDWLTFSGHLTTSNNYCLNALDLDWLSSTTCPTSTGDSNSYALGAEYKKQFNRDVVLTDLGAGSISASVTVSWKDTGGNILSVPIQTIYAQTQ